jgi:hypothetical protein
VLDRAKTLIGLRLRPTDGEIGRVHDLYFDDHFWIVRYLVADTGDWLDGRQVLLSPHVLTGVNRPEGCIDIALTIDQIERGPSAERHKPVSRRFELEYSWRFGMPAYWGFEREKQLAHRRIRRGDPHLRSVRAVLGYALHAADGEIGRVEDFLVEDESWAIRYLIVDTHRWLPGKKVLLSPDWIEHISWHHQEAVVGLDREVIECSPEYRYELPVERAYESALHRHYDRSGYWEDAGSSQDEAPSISKRPPGPAGPALR